MPENELEKVEKIKEDKQNPEKMDNEVKQVSEFEKEELFDPNNIAALIDKSKVDSAEKIKKSNDIKIEIQGHTDDIGPDESNLALSMDRAFNVMEYLLINGIEKDRLRFKGYGETNPKVPNNSSKSRAINRRTDFLIF